MSSNDFIGYIIEGDLHNGLRYMSIAGCVLSYITIFYNIVILIVLFRPNLRSPTTVLMQGLAIADLLTGFCSYGLEPIFQMKYITVNDNLDSSTLTLKYPYCALYVNISQMVDLFHLVSVLLTTCLGIQKVLALKFPFWVRNNIKINFAMICCLACLGISFIIHIPRHLAVGFTNRQNISYKYFTQNNVQEEKFLNTCSPRIVSRPAFLYAARYYPLVSAVLLLILSAIMCLSVIYIVYRLCHKTFRKKNIVQRSREKRSVLMITAVLIIFLISEIPRLSLYGYLFFGTYLDNMIGEDDALSFVVTDYRATLSVSMKVDADISFTQSLLIIESLKLFSLIGCMSNFVIYFTMSRQLRTELKVCLPYKSK